jgi:hypothetical protein
MKHCLRCLILRASIVGACFGGLSCSPGAPSALHVPGPYAGQLEYWRRSELEGRTWHTWYANLSTPYEAEVQRFRESIENSGYVVNGQSEKSIGGRRPLANKEGYAQIVLLLGPTREVALSGIKVLRTPGADPSRCSIIYKEFLQ